MIISEDERANSVRKLGGRKRTCPSHSNGREGKLFTEQLQMWGGGGWGGGEKAISLMEPGSHQQCMRQGQHR